MKFEDINTKCNDLTEFSTELYGERELSRSVEWDGETIKTVETENQSGAGLRVLKGDKIGFSYANESNLRPDWLVDQAGTAQSFMETDEFNQLPSPPDCEQFDDTWFDPEFENSIGPRTDQITNQISSVIEREPVQNLQVNYSEKKLRTNLFRDRNEIMDQKVSRFSLSVWAVCEEDGDVQSGFQRQTVPNFDELQIGEIHSDAVQEGVLKLGATPPESRSGPAILSPKAASTLLRLIQQMIDGEAIMKNKSAWGNERLGEEVADESITIVDDPGLSAGASNVSYDCEGYPITPLTVVDDGIYTNFFTNSYVSGRMNIANNHRSSRSFRSRPFINSTNLYIESGTSDLESLKETLGTGPVVTSIQPGSGLDPIAGHFSVGAGGYFLKNGEYTHAFDEGTITGEIDDFLKNVHEVGKSRPRGYSIASPALLVDNLSLGGD